MMRTGKCPAISFVFCLLGSLAIVACDQPVAIDADRIFHNAHILTMSFENEHDEMTIANAVAIKDGRMQIAPVSILETVSSVSWNPAGQQLDLQLLGGDTVSLAEIQTIAE